MTRKLNLRIAFAAVSVVALLTGCDDSTEKVQEQRIQIYASAEECRKDHTQEECDKAFEGAKEAHAEKAPRYKERGSCEDIYGVGKCVPRREGDNDVFLPLMAGFLVGHMLSSGPSVQPVYIDRNNSAFAPGQGSLGTYRNCQTDPSYCRSGGGGSSGGYVARTTTTSSAAGSSVWSNPAYKPQSVTVPRGGFGGSASSLPAIGGKPMGNSAIATGPVARGGFGATATSVAVGE